MVPRMRIVGLVGLVCLLSSSVVSAADLARFDDLAKAQAAARRKNTDTTRDKNEEEDKEDDKDIFILFTCSDHGQWTRRFDQQILSDPEFEQKLAEHFVMLLLDYPKQKEQPEKVKERNAELAKHYGVRGYPAVVLADVEGRAYARTSYRKGGIEAYLTHLDELRKIKAQRDDLFAKANRVRGIARAKLLHQALDVLREADAMVGYGPEIEQIIALDADNQANLKAVYLAPGVVGRATALYLEHKPQQAIDAYDAFIAQVKPRGHVLHEALTRKGMMEDAIGQRQTALESIRRALKAAPKGQYSPHLPAKMKQIEAAIAAEKQDAARQ